MALTERFLELESIIPLQVVGISLPHVAKLATVSELPPIEVLEYNRDLASEPKFLLLNGTHRAYLAYKRGEDRVAARVVSEDDDLKYLKANLTERFKTVDRITAYYETILLPELGRLGVSSVATLVTHNVSRDGLFDLIVDS